MTSPQTAPNHFGHLRLLASFAVLISHAFIIYGLPEPLQATGFYNTLGGVAVYVFFTMSGYLISQSFARSRSLSNYFTKRALRIMPALYVVVIISSLMIGPIISQLSAKAYFSGAQTYGYLLKNLLFWCRPADVLPGVFIKNASQAVNGSLWTLPYEAIAYVSLPLLALLHKPINVKFVAGVTCLLFAIAFLPWEQAFPSANNLLVQKSDSLHVSGGFFYYFYAGVLLNFLPLKYFRPIIFAILFGIALGLVVAGAGVPIMSIASALCLPYCVIYLATRAAAPNKFNHLIETHDLSFGVYIWGFFVEQVMAEQKIFANFFVYILTCAVITTAIAFLSWTYIEAPALQFKNKINR